MKFKFYDAVKITKGFYEGCTGEVYHYNETTEMYEIILDGKYEKRICCREEVLEAN